jgi:DNA-directed RNA polymerase alpha subunit
MTEKSYKCTNCSFVINEEVVGLDYSSRLIEDLKQVNRQAINCLKTNNVNTIGDLLNTNRELLFSLRGLGIKGLTQIYDSLLKLGIKPHFNPQHR